MALMYSPSPVAARRYGISMDVATPDTRPQEYLPCGIQKFRRDGLLSTMVSLAPTSPHGLSLASVISADCAVVGVVLSDVPYLNLVLVREDGIAVNVGEGLVPSALASDAKRTEDRGIFKAKRTAIVVV